MNSIIKRRAAIANMRLLVIVAVLLILSLVAWKMWPHGKKSKKAGIDHVQKTKKHGGKKMKSEKKIEATKAEEARKSGTAPEPAVEK